jgi:PAS domain S-box-containing protein
MSIRNRYELAVPDKDTNKYSPANGLFTFDFNKQLFILSEQTRQLLGASTTQIKQNEFLNLFESSAADSFISVLSRHYYGRFGQVTLAGLKLNNVPNAKLDIHMQLLHLSESDALLNGLVTVSSEKSLLPSSMNSTNADTVYVVFQLPYLTVKRMKSTSETIFGYAKYMVESSNFWLENVHADFQGMVESEISSMSPHNATKVIQYKFRFACGEYHWVQSRLSHFFESGSDKGSVEMVTYDIENYQKAFDKIIEEGNYNKQLIQHLSHVFFLINSNGRFIRWNDRLKEISGYTDEEIAQMRPTDFFPSQSSELLQQLIRKVYETGRVETEAVFVSKQGESKPVLLIGSTVEYNGELCLSGVGIDISSQKQLIEEQKLLKEQFERIFDSSLDLIFTLTPQGEIQSVNKAAKSILGFEPNELNGKNIIDLVCQDYQEETESFFQQLIAGQVISNFENCCETESGEIVFLLWSVNWSEKEQLLYCVAKNITERKAAQQELKANEEKFRMLVQEGADLIAIVDASGCYSYLSANYFKILGYTDDDLMGESGFDFIHPNDVAAAREEFQMVAKNGRFESSPYRFRAKDGQYRWMRTIGTLAALNKEDVVIINSTDITSIIDIQERLNFNNAWYEQVNKITKDVLYDWNMQTDKIVWSDEFYRKFGYSQEEIQTYDQLLRIEHREDELIQRSAWKQFLLEKNRYEWHSEIRIQHKNGSYLFIQDIGIVIRDQAGVPIRMIGVLRDISSQKRKEIKNEVLNESRTLFGKEAPLKEILSELCKYIATKSNAVVVEFWMNSEEREATDIFAHSLNQQWLEDSSLTGISSVQSFLCGEGIPGKAWQDNRITIWRQIQDNTDFIRQELARQIDVSTALAVPLSFKEKSIGQFVLLFSKESPSVLEFHDFFDELAANWASEIYRKKKEEEFRLLFESSPDIMAVASKEGRFLRVNPAFCELLGFSQEELTKQPFSKFMHPDDLAATLSEFEETIGAERNSKGFINRYRVKTGGYRYISWSSSDTFGADGLVFAYGRDVTDLMELRRLLNHASELAKVGGWEVDAISNQVYWSEKVSEIIGSVQTKTLNELIQLIKNDNRESFQSKFESCLTEGLSFDTEVPIETNQGEKWFRFIGQPDVVDGKTSRVIGSLQDINDRKVMELKMSSLNTEILKNMKELEKVNSELEQFAFVASHDLQEPLRMVTGFLTLLEKRYGNQLDEKAKSYIDFAVDGSNRMRSIILDLLEFSRAGKIETSEIDFVDLNFIVGDVMTLLNTAVHEADALVEIGELPTIKAVPAQMRQVFQNLISNGIKYRSADQQCKLEVGYDADDNGGALYVRDNGIGIDSDYHDTIFEIFKRLHSKEEYAGTGIGLAITKKIIDSMGWEIAVISNLNEGTEFRIYGMEHAT